MYEIFRNIPHQRVTGKNAEIFDLFQCGEFNGPTHQECLELVRLEPEMVYSLHYHKNSTAIIYVILGKGQFLLGNKEIVYQPGNRIVVLAGTYHGFKTVTETLFLSIQSPSIIDQKTGEIDIHYPGQQYDKT